MSDAVDVELDFLSDAGVCGAIVRRTDWTRTAFGPVSSWSEALKTALNFVLHSRVPMILYWGPELAVIYNDACLQTLSGGRPPAALGTTGLESFEGAWSTLEPDVKRAMQGTAVFREDALIFMTRDGHLEEAYWTYGKSPIFDGATTTVRGVLGTFTESTDRVIADRRLRTLRVLGERLADVQDAADLVPAALEALRDSRLDMPFVAVFHVDDIGCVELHASNVDLGDALGPLQDAVRAHVEQIRNGCVTCVTFEPVVIPSAPWPDPIEAACAIELSSPADARARSIFVFGLSPRLAFDHGYRAHLGNVAAAVAQAHARIEVVEARATAQSEHRSLLMQAPVATALMVGADHCIKLANRAFIELAGREVVGKSFFEAFPELADTEIPIVLDRVYRTGQPYGTQEKILPLKRGGVIEDRWFSLNVDPVRDRDGRIYGVMAVTHEITEAVVARRALERLSAERQKLLSALETANRSKDEFLAMLGHELRNPLAPITTALHLMKLKEPCALVRERAIIERQAGHLVHLVDDLLDVSRVARGKVRLNKSHVALADVVARAVEMASPLFEQKRHTLTVEVPAIGLDVDGDPIRLGQVMSNLLTNAAKYTEPGGRVAVRGYREGALAIVRVEDNGAGIRCDQLTHIFDAFFQGPRASDRALGGLGLGLALVKSFVTLHGGTVLADSRGPGCGSVFEVRLPALPPDVGAILTLPIEALVVPEETPRRRVLLVDDSEDILEIVSALLRYEGYEVLEAHDGPSALQLAPSFRPDVAVLDIGLPAMDGYDLAQHLREELGDSAPKLIAMTGYGQEADRERARRAGFAVHLVKPVDPSKLLESIRA